MSVNTNVTVPAGNVGIPPSYAATSCGQSVTGTVPRTWLEETAGAEELGDRPGLERAAGARVRRGAVRPLGHRAEPPLLHLGVQALEHALDPDARPERRPPL